MPGDVLLKASELCALIDSRDLNVAQALFEKSANLQDSDFDNQNMKNFVFSLQNKLKRAINAIELTATNIVQAQKSGACTTAAGALSLGINALPLPCMNLVGAAVEGAGSRLGSRKETQKKVKVTQLIERFLPNVTDQEEIFCAVALVIASSFARQVYDTRTQDMIEDLAAKLVNNIVSGLTKFDMSGEAFQTPYQKSKIKLSIISQLYLLACEPTSSKKKNIFTHTGISVFNTDTEVKHYVRNNKRPFHGFRYGTQTEVNNSEKVTEITTEEFDQHTATYNTRIRTQNRMATFSMYQNTAASERLNARRLEWRRLQRLADMSRRDAAVFNEIDPHLRIPMELQSNNIHQNLLRNTPDRKNIQELESDFPQLAEMHQRHLQQQLYLYDLCDAKRKSLYDAAVKSDIAEKWQIYKLRLEYDTLRKGPLSHEAKLEIIKDVTKDPKKDDIAELRANISGLKVEQLLWAMKIHLGLGGKMLGHSPCCTKNWFDNVIYKIKMLCSPGLKKKSSYLKNESNRNEYIQSLSSNNLDKTLGFWKEACKQQAEVVNFQHEKIKRARNRHSS